MPTYFDDLANIGASNIMSRLCGELYWVGLRPTLH